VLKLTDMLKKLNLNRLLVIELLAVIIIWILPVKGGTSFGNLKDTLFLLAWTAFVVTGLIWFSRGKLK